MNNCHQQFLAGQVPLHPILQQIQANSERLYLGSPDQGVPNQSVGAVTATTVPADDVALDIAQEGLRESTSEEVFSSYKHREVVKGCQPHPGDIVEAAPLAALDLPKEYYPVTDSLPAEAITQGKLSCLQLEGIIHACQRHQRILANGQRAGFFIGDGAGVGKGRQIAGIILDNIARGRTRHIWFTISADLIVDSRRDLTDIGCHTNVINGCQELDRETRVLGLPANFQEGIVFSTYATLVSSVQSGGKFNSVRRSRLQQLIDWCGGPAFEGCLIFDECHKAKNFVPNKEQASTKVAIAVTEIQRLLPKARVVYCSATGVSDVKNMAFMERMGLWGDGAPFKSFVNFLETVQRKGLGVAEMLAMEMKSSGMYVSRGLSFRQAEFMIVSTVMTEEQNKVYNVSATLWSELRRSLDIALARTNTPVARAWTTYWGAHQRFFKQMLMGMKVPAAVKEAKAALDDGHCVVIGLQSTGEAALDTELQSHSLDGPDKFISVCREIFKTLVRVYFPIHKTGNPGTEPVVDEWCAEAKRLMLDYIDGINLPNSPLDEMIDQLGGPDKVAEMTGRKGRMVRRWPNSKPVYEQRGVQGNQGSLENLNVKERNLFMAGKKLVAIISDAASTGISLHADERVANRRRRVHITIELPWSADKAVQQLGRSHRSNQCSGPVYKLLMTGLGGERRFVAAVAHRLESLGALTKGDRRAAAGIDLREFNFDTPYGRAALRSIYTSICQQHIAPGVDLSKQTSEDFATFNNRMQECLVLMGLVEADTLLGNYRVDDKFLGDVGKFLNRILGLRIDLQGMIFDYFTDCLDVIIQNAKREGRYDEGLQDISAASIQMVGEPREVFADLLKGHGTTRLMELEVDRGLDWDHAMTRHDNYKAASDMTGFYVSKREMFGRRMYILVTPKDNSTHLFHIARPSTGVSSFDQEKSDLLLKYMPISIEKAKKGWEQSYEHSKDNCMHGRACKHKNTCTVGKRCYHIHLLCGNIATLMTVLETTLLRNAPLLGLSKFESRLRVVRVATDGGERVVGVRYPEVLIPEVEQTLRDQKLVERMQRVQAVLAHKQQQDDPALSAQLAALASAPGAQSKPYMFSQAAVEDVAPVNAKLRAKALKPAVTIKSFFKPKAAASTSTASGAEASKVVNQERGEKETRRESEKKNLKEFSQPRESQELNGKMEESGDEQSAAGPDSQKNECDDSVAITESSAPQSEENKNYMDTTTPSSDLGSVESEKNIEGCDSESLDYTKPNGSGASKNKALDKEGKQSSLSEVTTRGMKRKASKLSQPVKTKPSKSAKVNKPDCGRKEEKEKKCPICDKKFHAGTWNDEINNHIDNCLIE